ncbi:hypothetical protein V0R50_20035 [Pseudomonas sp. 148P]|uniref:Uncharacterized protein n=1 Tax=Pseudomonas ulcerans TaxID=3115852 RepID=A0ABU7HVH4_9PSED|nr:MULTISPECIES: hypothetical protein [unclassified Pseudomonas]MEE1924145.1 hypothetical protein [Pseudomonas sp. 147P]MEE1935528.1 hypothetical protein [Pseudomonas sp. 148P]
MTLFYLKLIVTPLLMWAVSLASRRWGGLLGGLLSGMPITSALVMVFLCLEQGSGFAVNAVPGALGGLAAVQASYACYLFSSRRVGIVPTVLVSLGCYGIAAYVLTHWAGLPLAIGVALCLVALLVWATGREARPAQLAQIKPRWWEIPLRMVAATSLLMLTTGTAQWLGPAVSGMLAPIPVIAWPLVVFSHVQGGRYSMAGMIRGNAIGGVGVIAFYLVIGHLLDHLGIALTFFLAVALAVVLTVGLATLLRSRQAR